MQSAIFIQEHLDPNANLRRSDNAAEVVAEMDRIFAAEGGCGVTVDEMAAYLATLEE